METQSNQAITKKLADLNKKAAELRAQLADLGKAMPPKISKTVSPQIVDKPKRLRAYFYLRLMPGGEHMPDKLYRVVGTGGLEACGQIEAQFPGQTQRLTSKQYLALVESRRLAMRSGTAKGPQGALEAVPLTGGKPD